LANEIAFGKAYASLWQSVCEPLAKRMRAFGKAYASLWQSVKIETLNMCYGVLQNKQ
jgi:hypothetical protein